MQQQLRAQTGTLRIQASTAWGALPIAQAQVTVQAAIGGGVVFEGQTDGDGVLSGIVLNTVSQENSQTPDDPLPASVAYNITVRRTGYTSMSFLQVPIYEGVESIQPVQMQPGDAEDVIVIEERIPQSSKTVQEG